MASILSDSEIRKLIESPKPLVSGYINLERQLQPAGFELTLAEVFSFKGFGSLGFEDEDRKLPSFKPIRLSAERFTRLPSGAYLVRYNEEVWLPPDLSALIFPRSSLMRSGAILYTAVWDPGYRGRGQGLLNVYNPHGIRLKLNARIGQLVFLRLSKPSRRLYRGIYQREGLA
ncbi:MAG: deoxyuridine 5'-triphosphate nucleotidohydrolase [Candidatus Hecatellaceae archaeon]